MKEKRTPRKKFSTLEITMMVLISVLIIAIIVQICIIANLNKNINDLKEKELALPTISTTLDNNSSHNDKIINLKI